ncbi:hypothetical protein [Catenuloplanes japonicus]|uniref:hypothetical protein n=1 Tax=Catenuloplanes japonicus TaxID=33876 RepID=UPI0012FAFDB7|nr:hypothetical protein [Catenuloplanes japonicus]
MDGRRYADEPEPQWQADRAWDAPADDARAPARPRRASDPLTDPTGYSDHWNVPRVKAPETPVPEVPAQPEVRSRRGYDYDAVTGRGLEALPVVTPTSAAPDTTPAPAEPNPVAGLTAAYPLTGDIPRYRTEALDRAALRRPPADPGAAPATPPPAHGEPEPGAHHAYPAAEPGYTQIPVAERVYTTRRPILAVPIGLVVLLMEFPALRLLLDGFTGGVAAAGNLVSGLALALSLPLTGFGLYALFTTGRAADHRTWWRPPLAHLPLGLVLLVAAAVAAR